VNVGFGDGGVDPKSPTPDHLVHLESGRDGSMDGQNALRADPAAPIGQRGGMWQRVGHPKGANPPPMKTIGFFLDQFTIGQLIPFFQVT
jgi:hypothetical protein